jgi:hypothetical protein
MVFIPPIGRPTAAKEGLAEDTVFKVGDLLEGRVVRPVGERYLFVDIGKQLRVKIHWELPFEVKPGEILHFEVVSDDPPTFKLVDRIDDQSRIANQPEPHEDTQGERVDLSSQRDGSPPAKVTYGPVKARGEGSRLSYPDVNEREESSILSPPKDNLHSTTKKTEGVKLPSPEGEEAFIFPEFLENEGEPLSSLVKGAKLPLLMQTQELAESIVDLLADEPFFTLYEEGEISEPLARFSNVDAFKSFLSGLKDEQLNLLKGLFKVEGERLEGLLKALGELVEKGSARVETLVSLDSSEPTNSQNSEIEAPHKEGNKITSNIGAQPSGEEPTFVEGEKSVGGTLAEPSVHKGPFEQVEPDRFLAEMEAGEVPLEEGGKRLAIRIWPATSRFTIDSSTPPPPGLELDVGDMLQGRVVEVEGNKVIIDFGSFETQATWEAAHTVKPGATIKVMVASLLPQLRLRLIDEAPLRGFMAKLGSMKDWGTLFSRLKGTIDLPFIQADKGERVLMRTLANFLSNNGLSTEARMAKVVEGDLPPDELKNDLKLQLAQLISKGGEGAHIEAAKELMQSINGHQLLNVQTQNSGFFIIPLVVAYHQRIDQWRMTMAEEEKEGERWFRITLLSSPPHLGTIRIDLGYEELSKRLDLLFWVEREEIKELVEHALPILKEEFTDSKVNLTKVEVGVSKGLSREDLPIEVKGPHLLQMRA